jgi:hypothetical protein
MKLYLPLIVLLIYSPEAWSQSLYTGIRNQFESTRALGMGNAFTAVSDDVNGIFYNPAGLSQLKEGQSSWFLKADADPSIAGFFNDIGNASDGPDSTQAITDVIQRNYGNHYSVRAPSMGFLWARKNWGLAVIPMDFSLDMGLNRTVGPSISLTAVQDTTVAFSYNWDINKWRNIGSFNVGVTTKLIYRMNVDEVVDVATISLNDQVFDISDAKEGLTLDADVGFLWKGPWQRYNPSAGLVIRNIGDYGYLSNFNLIGEGTGSPERLHRVIDLGYAMDMPDFWIWSWKVAFDMRNMLHPFWTFQKGLHVGAEFLWQVTSWFKGGWRAGLNQGHWTAGFTGQFGIFRLDLASYGEQLGVHDLGIQNRRYMMTMSLDF